MEPEKKASGPGRPTKAPNDRKSSILRIRIKPELKARLALSAQENERSLSSEASYQLAKAVTV